MDSYTITIAPNDDSGAATRLVVDTTGDQVRITDVHLHAPQGLSSGHIPTVDFELLLQAVTGTVTASTGQRVVGASELSASSGTLALDAAAADQPDEQPGVAEVPKRRARKTTPRATATPAPRRSRARTSENEAAAPRRSARAAATSTTRAAEQAPVKATRKAAAAKTPPAPVKKRAATRATARANSKTTAKRTRAAATTAAPVTSGRAYRVSPDDLAAVFDEIGTAAGVAEHYQVPRHTAQGWIRRLRSAA
ncbi:hypothetical protein [Actinoplanes sp. NBRC 103695]|uniref:hypothetical protein n=1 Tax=Actinoplanes sp. NBRC 103695 TaxID=3032202 RepID=UPI0024A25B1C|nr:hypothetical protein [Actinoplanes sp. NBRC 103695]GLY94107.1 hypothetical protein Acsp02_13630 [Actinoplanes sp. NBRC 103695]